MEIGICRPESKENQVLSEKAVATAHADLITHMLNSLPCSMEQKALLVKAILLNIRSDR